MNQLKELQVHINRSGLGTLSGYFKSLPIFWTKTRDTTRQHFLVSSMSPFLFKRRPSPCQAKAGHLPQGEHGTATNHPANFVYQWVLDRVLGDQMPSTCCRLDNEEFWNLLSGSLISTSEPFPPSIPMGNFCKSYLFLRLMSSARYVGRGGVGVNPPLVLLNHPSFHWPPLV